MVVDLSDEEVEFLSDALVELARLRAWAWTGTELTAWRRVLEAIGENPDNVY